MVNKVYKSYSKRLTPYAVGKVGAVEWTESESDANKQIKEMVRLFQNSKRIVFLVGAGISTSANIRDFRGEKGVWTEKMANLGKPDIVDDDYECFEKACPTLSHMAIKQLIVSGLVQFLVSQNVDDLHGKSGLRGVHTAKLSEIHGNLMKEYCPNCKTVYMRAFDVGGLSRKPTGRRCSQKGCCFSLVDDCLDWNDPLDPDELEISQHMAENDCLGFFVASVSSF